MCQSHFARRRIVTLPKSLVQPHKQVTAVPASPQESSTSVTITPMDKDIVAAGSILNLLKNESDITKGTTLSCNIDTELPETTTIVLRKSNDGIHNTTSPQPACRRNDQDFMTPTGSGSETLMMESCTTRDDNTCMHVRGFNAGRLLYHTKKMMSMETSQTRSVHRISKDQILVHRQTRRRRRQKRMYTSSHVPLINRPDGAERNISSIPFLPSLGTSRPSSVPMDYCQLFLHHLNRVERLERLLENLDHMYLTLLNDELMDRSYM